MLGTEAVPACGLSPALPHGRGTLAPLRFSSVASPLARAVARLLYISKLCGK